MVCVCEKDYWFVRTQIYLLNFHILCVNLIFSFSARKIKWQIKKRRSENIQLTTLAHTLGVEASLLLYFFQLSFEHVVSFFFFF